ncbi:L-dopachrome tautomerase-related protein [Mucilaginibacter jinjuensis]|uniref:L-dopachrome tautomerase-related protein n=1 Tax=Mucilaginibacter jinjuensis TaxID=1176721 RepID=A0ABY7TBR3_9SPHI|nr:L-dopachrome tautomerase-related protein [Mucilaginibacter jinjuensis]WCT13758.1 L-dopachrome tautomerase-related protein [Mucilaginibacter jinjuensis]
MKNSFWGLILIGSVIISLQACKKDNTANKPNTATLEQVYADSTYELAGISVTPSGRFFVSYPYWLDKHGNSVVEIGGDKKPHPFPDATWNSFQQGQDGNQKFVSVQALYADDQNNLWILDPANIGFGNVYLTANKLVQVDLGTNTVKRIIRFPANVAGSTSFLNDVRVDNTNQVAYISNTTGGGIVVVDLNTGNSRWVMGGITSTTSDPAYHFNMNGKELATSQGVFKGNTDGIELSPDKAWVYYKCLTDNHLYRVSTAALRNFSNSESDVEATIQKVGDFVATDGMIFDKAGNLYLGDIENARIVKISPDKTVTTLVQDKDKLSWPDSYSISPDGYLYISCSQIQQLPFFNNNQNITQYPYRVFRLKLNN